MVCSQSAVASEARAPDLPVAVQHEWSAHARRGVGINLVEQRCAEEPSTNTRHGGHLSPDPDHPDVWNHFTIFVTLSPNMAMPQRLKIPQQPVSEIW
jgi:hypothetical protein